MISPLVKPIAGYSTLSRLDSSSSRPPTRTSRRSGIDALLRGQVRPQSQEPGEAQPAVRGALPVPDFHHDLWTYPGRVLRILPGQRFGERGTGRATRRQLGQQRPLGRGGYPATDPAPEEQPPVRPRYPDQQRAERARAGPVSADDELRRLVGLVLDPVGRADPRPVHRLQSLGDHALQAVLADRGERRGAVGEGRGYPPPLAGQLQPVEQGAPLRV